MQHRFTNQVALITGGGRGIGQATARQLAAEGAQVVIGSRTREELEETVRDIRRSGGQAVFKTCDIANHRDVVNLVDFTVGTYHRIDLLINHAGILGPRVSVVDYPTDAWSEVLAINLTGPFYLSQQVARVMIGQQAGLVVHISSSVGRRGRAQWGAYAVAKFGVEGLSQVMAEELAPHGIRVVTFNPGGTRTRMRAEAYPDEDPADVPTPRETARRLLDEVADPALKTGMAL